MKFTLIDPETISSGDKPPQIYDEWSWWRCQVQTSQSVLLYSVCSVLSVLPVLYSVLFSLFLSLLVLLCSFCSVCPRWACFDSISFKPLSSTSLMRRMWLRRLWILRLFFLNHQSNNNKSFTVMKLRERGSTPSRTNRHSCNYSTLLRLVWAQ